jgi:hypothetical protein
MEKSTDRSEEINLKLQLIKNELMSNLGPSTRAKSGKKKENNSAKKESKLNKGEEAHKDPEGAEVADGHDAKTKNSLKKKSTSTTAKKKPAHKISSKSKKETESSSPAKKKKKSTTSEEIDTETDITTRKWDDSKGRKLLKGNFSAEEEKKVMNAICEYAYNNDLDEDNLIKLITEKQIKSESSAWTKISECLTNRSVQSIHNFCHRKFNPYNYKGDWSDQEVENLINLHKELGPKWELIGKELERTATNVKDKFKQIGGKNFKNRVKEFNLLLCLKLLKYIQSFINDGENESPLEIFKYSYKFKNNLEDQHNSVYHIAENKCLLDSAIKETPSRIIIRNILKLIVDSEALEKILDQKIEISWSSIAENFSVYSATDCKNNWDKILREFDLWEKGQLRKDLKMVKQYTILSNIFIKFLAF